jgi:hypothetical protein
VECGNLMKSWHGHVPKCSRRVIHTGHQSCGSCYWNRFPATCGQFPRLLRRYTECRNGTGPGTEALTLGACDVGVVIVMGNNTNK